MALERISSALYRNVLVALVVGLGISTGAGAGTDAGAGTNASASAYGR